MTYQEVMKNGKLKAQTYSRWNARWSAIYRYKSRTYYIHMFNGKVDEFSILEGARWKNL